MIIMASAQEVFQQLPMEFAVERRTARLELEAVWDENEKASSCSMCAVLTANVCRCPAPQGTTSSARGEDPRDHGPNGSGKSTFAKVLLVTRRIKVRAARCVFRARIC